MARRFLALVSAAAALSAAGCGSDLPPEECVLEETCDEGDCVPAPEGGPAPAIISPVAGRLDVIPATLEVVAGDPPAGIHLETEAEIHRFAGGEPLLRVWRATLERPDPESPESAAPTRFVLEDGEFEGTTQETGLLEWEDYSVRVRYRTLATEADCSAWTAWSEHRVFRIDDGSSYVFDDSQILDVALEISPESMEAIDAEARPPGCVPHSRSYYPGNAIVDGERFDGAGMRVKGGCGSARNLNEKAAFKVHLSYDNPDVAGCPETRRTRGLQRLTLNNMVQDRSFTHERLGYHYYKLMGIPTPRVAHARLSVNDEPWGLYLNVETIDRRMLSRWFESKQGALFEGTYFCDLIPDNVPPEDNPDTTCLGRKFKPDECSSDLEPGADPRDYSTIRELTDVIAALPDGGFYPAIEEIFEYDRFLSMWAAEAVMSHWDNHAFNIINNYRVYHDPVTDRWTVLPTGIDQTFGTQGGNLVVNVDPFAVSAVLATRCLAEPACEEAFVDRLRQALEVFETAGLVEMAMEIDAQIAGEVTADPRKPGSVEDYQTSHQAILDFIERRPGEIRAHIQARGF
jgi:hypothetical protein